MSGDTRWNVFLHNFKHFLLGIDQLVNVGIGLAAAVLALLFRFLPEAPRYWSDETLSAHAWRWRKSGVVSWPCRVIDALALVFRDRNHCEESYLSEALGRQLPPEYRGGG